ncbi:MAG TPA: hypothetical protein VL154_08145 [Acetobacteraceae bacterium]|jgi:hypothetical protein|nr:hypothetical protein [Acetobacteraceae bacterium]
MAAENSDDDSGLSSDLNQSGQVIDKAVEHLIARNVDPIAVASAMLGAALGLLARGLSDEMIVGVLNNAIASVRSGEFRQMEH